MNLIIHKTDKLAGEIFIPGSKSHTIRGLVFAALAKGSSQLKNPLSSADTQAAFQAIKALGAKIDSSDPKVWKIHGFGAKPHPPNSSLNMLNSGTSTNLLTSVAALGDFKVIIDGDPSIRRRSVQPLIDALNQLGAKAESMNNNHCPPLSIQGPLKGGQAKVDGKSSQYVSSLLITCPLLPHDTELQVVNLCEIPYIQMTLDWLQMLNIKFEHEGYGIFRIPGRQTYQSFTRVIPADWSSATFPLCAAAMLESSKCLIKGVDLEDSQADREVIEHLKKMGAGIEITEQGILVQGKGLKGTELDLNNTPDALPAIAAASCVAEGETKIINVAHARIKETDRIRVMAMELGKMGANIQETNDGLIIKKSRLKGTQVHGHHDHRVVMALTLAGMAADGITSIDTAEAVKVTFPNYTQIMKILGSKMEMDELLS